ncbi:DUF2313 domain-containing protein [Clostridiaceae bacterium M8S5]|nr:DUF2313 domain-containing protein [Clostridiaceae bacterium M8S5]
MKENRTDIKHNLPEYYHDIKDIEYLSESLNALLDDLKQSREAISKNFFMSDMDEIGIERWERVFNIKSNKNESIEFRKNRIISKYQSRPPITIRSLESILNNYFDKPILSIKLVPNEYAFRIEFMATDATLYKEIEKQIKELKAANMEHIPTPKAKSYIKFKSAAKKIDIERKTRLGTTWKLGETPFGEVKNEEVLF